MVGDRHPRGSTTPGERGPTDARICAAVAGGDHSLVAILWGRYADGVHVSATRLVGVEGATDVVAETFARSLRALMRRGRTGTYPELLDALLEQVAAEYAVLPGPMVSGTGPLAISGPAEKVSATSASGRPVVAAWRTLSRVDRQALWSAELDHQPSEHGAAPRYRNERLAYLTAGARDRLRWALARASVTSSTPLACRRRRRDLPGYVRGSLPRARRASLERHLIRCPTCPQVASDLAFVGRTLRRDVSVRPVRSGALRFGRTRGRLVPGASMRAPAQVAALERRKRLPVLVAAGAVLAIVAATVVAGQLLTSRTTLVDETTPTVATGLPSAPARPSEPTTTPGFKAGVVAPTTPPARKATTSPPRPSKPARTSSAAAAPTYGPVAPAVDPAPVTPAPTTPPAPTSSDGPSPDPPIQRTTTFSVTTDDTGTVAVAVSNGWTITEASSSDLGVPSGLNSSVVVFAVPEGGGPHVITIIAQAASSVVSGTATLTYARVGTTEVETQTQPLA